MKLQEYLDKHEIAWYDFAKQGKWSIYAVRKWISGERIPLDHNKIKIAKLTDNKVRAQDWLKGL